MTSAGVARSPGSRMNRTFQRLAGATALLLGLAGIAHASRAGLAHAIYHRLKYGSRAEGVPPGLSRADQSTAERAHGLYPWNASLCEWVADCAFYDGPGPDDLDEPERRRLARLWCQRGLALNRYGRPLHLIRARERAIESAPAGLACWREYLDWHYWDPYNHAVLASLHAKAGEYEHALDALEMARDSEHYAVARAEILEAWRRERTAPR
jgi:tetratricopeptide (TPR) repeat protein